MRPSETTAGLSAFDFGDSETSRRCLRDIVALSTLPALWSGADPQRIAESLAAALFTALTPALVCVACADGAGVAAVAQTGRYHTEQALGEQLAPLLAEWTRAHDPDEFMPLPNPLGHGTLQLSVRPIGHHAELGVIGIASSEGPQPTFYQLVASVAATQAATAIQNSQLLRSLRDNQENLRHTNAELATRVAELRRHERHQVLLINELNHRVKNTLAIVQSMAAQTLRGRLGEGEQAGELFEHRLIALAKAHDVLTRESWEGAPLGIIVHDAIAPYAGTGQARFRLEGPELWVSPKYALAIAMALHELCTNAVKYGALSNPSGGVAIVWAAEGADDARRLRLCWTESGGPPVVSPTRRGFGTRLIQQGLKYDLGGEVQMDFAPTGLVFRMDAPLESANGAFLGDEGLIRP